MITKHQNNLSFIRIHSGADIFLLKMPFGSKYGQIVFVLVVNMNFKCIKTYVEKENR